MTPKEQALKIYDKFFNNAESRNKIGLYDEDLHKYNTKQCTLIAVDEIILANPHSNTFTNVEYSTMEYWQEVKQEVEKL
jgi:hypothetical protein